MGEGGVGLFMCDFVPTCVCESMKNSNLSMAALARFACSSVQHVPNASVCSAASCPCSAATTVQLRTQIDSLSFQ